MTPQEQQMIAELAQKITSTPVTQKDVQAEQFIQQQFARDPDALYKLVQTVLVQNFAIDQAHQQIARLQQSQGAQPTPPPQEHTSFLGKLFSGGQQESAPPRPQAPAPQYTPPPAAPQYGGGMAGGGSAAGGFLRGAAQTAAGVAAGALAFEGVSSLLHGLGGHGGGMFGGNLADVGGMGGGSFLGGAPGGETIINNYYEQPGGSDASGYANDQQAADLDNASYQDQGDAQDDYSDDGGDQDYDDGSDDGGFDDGGDGGDMSV